MSKPGGIDIALPARPESSSQLRRALRTYLENVLEASRIDDVVLAAGEATGNAIEHAYRGADGSVVLRAYVNDALLVVEVSDRGKWRLDGDPERGRGLGIMRALVDHVSIESTHVGTNVRLEVTL